MARFGEYGTYRQREEFGGINWGAAFFGWLVAVGLGALLTALVSAAGAAIAISEFQGVGTDEIGIGGAILLIIVALIAYFAGGYVAGRMSRFDGGRQGMSVWVLSIVIAIVLAILGGIAGAEWNLFAGLDLPRVPIDEGDVTTGGIIVLLIILAGTLLAAMAGGKAGERYHRRVDDLGAAPLRRHRETPAEEAREEAYEEREEHEARRGRGTRPAHP